MILHDVVGDENNPVYKELEVSNGTRQYDFLRSIVVAAIDSKKPFLSTLVLKALNFHAIACLHTKAGEFRPCEVIVGDYHPPAQYLVNTLMDDFVNEVNRMWEVTNPIVLSAYVVWRLNHIHPFINGNGRTARAAAYFVLCVSAGKWLPGKTILPELLRQNRDEYVEALKAVDNSILNGVLDIKPLHDIIERLLGEQLSDEDSASTNS